MSEPFKCRLDHTQELCCCIPTEQELPPENFTCYFLFRLVEAGRRKFIPSIQLYHRFSFVEDFTEEKESIEWGTRDIPDLIRVVYDKTTEFSWRLNIRDESGKNLYTSAYGKQEVTSIACIILTNMLRFFTQKWISQSYDCI